MCMEVVVFLVYTKCGLLTKGLSVMGIVGYLVHMKGKERLGSCP